jgi:phosphoribosylanthranilate isomerase
VTAVVGADAAGLKICGICSADDLRACRDAGVDAIGVNLWEGSKRYVPVPDAARMLDEVRREGPLPRVVLVVVDPQPDALADAIAALAPDAVQLHGDAPHAGYASALAATPWIRVLRGAVDLGALPAVSPAPAWVLLDAAVAGYGGQGVTLPWAFAAAAVSALAGPVWLAGGLSPKNAAEALARVRPHGLDVASGAEHPADPRRKDRAAIAALSAICKKGGG